MTDDQKIEKIIGILRERYSKTGLFSDRDIEHKIKLKIKNTVTDLVEFKQLEAVGNCVPIDVKFPRDIWGAVLERIEGEGIN